MNLMKYVIAAGVALVISIVAMFLGDFTSGLLIFILLLGGYIMWNVLNGIKSPSKEVTQGDPNRTPPTPSQDN